MSPLRVVWLLRLVIRRMLADSGRGNCGLEWVVEVGGGKDFDGPVWLVKLGLGVLI